MRSRRSLLVASIPLALSYAACLSPPTLPPRHDGGARDVGVDAWAPTFEVLGVDVGAANGRAWPADAAPRTPTITVRFSSPPSDASPIVLLRGPADAALATELAGTHLRAATLARRIDATNVLSGAEVAITPTAPLEPGSVVTLAVPSWVTNANDDTLVSATTRVLTISTAADAGARATASWPPDGAFEVAPALSRAAIRFDGTISDAMHALELTDATGAVVPAAPMSSACPALGWHDGVCVSLIPSARLAPSTQHTLALAPGALDATGAPMPPFAAHFTTAGSAPTPLTWLPIVCGIGEATHAASHGCARTDDESLTFRGQLSAAARLAWQVGRVTSSTISPRGEVTLRVGNLAPRTPYTLGLEALDYAGRQTMIAFTMPTTEPLATISITEVRAAPAGRRPRQEYVEILNYGAAPVSLAGLSLGTAAVSLGDALPNGTVPPGARALIVSADFDPSDTADGRDVAVPPGTPLVRVAGSLAGHGLSSTGSALYLRDALGRWVSAAPATPPPMQAVCNVRTSTSPRDGEAGTFSYDPHRTCTPGS